MRKIFVSMVALLALALVAGCGSSGDGSSSGQGTSSDAPTAEGTSAEGTSAHYELHWADGSPTVMDSAKAFNQIVLRNIALGLEGLVKIAPDGKVVPALAESVERKDATTYVYKLPDGIKFSDGTPLTTADVVYSLKRYQADDSQNAADYENVKSITAEGNDIVVKLKQPDETWQFVPAYAGYVVEKAQAEKVGSDKLGTPGNLPIGTGPWKFDSFQPDVGLELSVNPYWRGGEPQADKISIRFIADQPATALALRSGEVDGTMNEPNVETFGNIPGVDLLSTPGPDQYFVSLNTIVAPFDDVHVRRAIAHAVNREGFVEAILNGAGEANNAVVPSTLFTNLGSEAEVDDMLSSLPDYSYDLEAAKRELAKSNYPDGFTTTTPVLASLPEFTRFAQVLKADLAKIGITLNIRETTDSDWLSILYGPRDQLGLFINKYGGTYPDPNQLLSYMLDPESAKVNGLNSANFKDPKIGKLIVEQRQEANPAKRLKMIGEILRISNEAAAYVPIAQSDRQAAVSDGYVLSEFSPWLAYGPWALNVKPAE